MGFGALWKKSGSQIIPTSGVDTIRIPDTGEYATLKRDSTNFTIDSATGGTCHLVLNAGIRAVKMQGNGTTKFEVCKNGIGFFEVTPIARIARPPVPAADPAQLVTAFDELQTKLAAYGLLS